jgi:hypothetical protein
LIAANPSLVKFIFPGSVPVIYHTMSKVTSGVVMFDWYPGEIENVISQLVARCPQAAVAAGTPGIGKSELVRVAVARASLHGSRRRLTRDEIEAMPQREAEALRQAHREVVMGIKRRMKDSALEALVKFQVGDGVDPARMESALSAVESCRVRLLNGSMLDVHLTRWMAVIGSSEIQREACGEHFRRINPILHLAVADVAKWMRKDLEMGALVAPSDKVLNDALDDLIKAFGERFAREGDDVMKSRLVAICIVKDFRNRAVQFQPDKVEGCRAGRFLANLVEKRLVNLDMCKSFLAGCVFDDLRMNVWREVMAAPTAQLEEMAGELGKINQTLGSAIRTLQQYLMESTPAESVTPKLECALKWFSKISEGRLSGVDESELTSLVAAIWLRDADASRRLRDSGRFESEDVEGLIQLADRVAEKIVSKRLSTDTSVSALTVALLSASVASRRVLMRVPGSERVLFSALKADGSGSDEAPKLPGSGFSDLVDNIVLLRFPPGGREVVAAMMGTSEALCISRNASPSVHWTVKELESITLNAALVNKGGTCQQTTVLKKNGEFTVSEGKENVQFPLPRTLVIADGALDVNRRAPRFFRLASAGCWKALKRSFEKGESVQEEEVRWVGPPACRDFECLERVLRDEDRARKFRAIWWRLGRHVRVAMTTEEAEIRGRLIKAIERADLSGIAATKVPRIVDSRQLAQAMLEGVTMAASRIVNAMQLTPTRGQALDLEIGEMKTRLCQEPPFSSSKATTYLLDLLVETASSALPEGFIQLQQGLKNALGPFTAKLVWLRASQLAVTPKWGKEEMEQAAKEVARRIETGLRKTAQEVETDLQKAAQKVGGSDGNVAAVTALATQIWQKFEKSEVKVGASDEEKLVTDMAQIIKCELEGFRITQVNALETAVFDSRPATGPTEDSRAVLFTIRSAPNNPSKPCIYVSSPEVARQIRDWIAEKTQARAAATIMTELLQLCVVFASDGTNYLGVEAFLLKLFTLGGGQLRPAHRKVEWAPINLERPFVVEFSEIKGDMILLTNGKSLTFAALEQLTGDPLFFIPRFGGRGACPAFDAVYVVKRRVVYVQGTMSGVQNGRPRHTSTWTMVETFEQFVDASSGGTRDDESVYATVRLVLTGAGGPLNAMQCVMGGTKPANVIFRDAIFDVAHMEMTHISGISEFALPIDPAMVELAANEGGPLALSRPGGF